MKDNASWIVFTAVTVLLFLYFVFSPVLNYGGDIVEYYGITESVLNHGNINLTPKDQENITKTLNPGYFNDPQYYIRGVGDNRYPVHFIFYSLLTIPVRLALKIFELNELRLFSLTNLLIFSSTIFIVLKYFLKSQAKKLAFLTFIYLSPLIWFLSWPGPDIYYTSLVLLSIFLFFNKKYIAATILASLASWHSQPLIVVALGFLAYYSLKSIHIYSINENKHLNITFNKLFRILVLLLLIAVPYLQNYLLFKVFSPWTILQNGWTIIYGFGFQNFQFKKLWEMVFDLNIGLLWYSPILMGGGIYYFIRSMINWKNKIFIIALVIVTAVFYQTNPAWNYGTSGFGPTRHILYALPFLIYFISSNYSSKIINFVIIGLFIVSQIYIFSFNGFLSPTLSNTFQHTPYAKYLLNNFPQFYEPTPEIFVDRTNHNDQEYLYTAVYKTKGICKKAYVLKSDKKKLIEECGFLPKNYLAKLDDDLSRKANFPRKVITNEATFWPDPRSCSQYPPLELPYVCMKNISDFVNYTGISDIKRISKLPEFPYTGVWKLKLGLPLRIIVPPGYIIDYNSIEGIYVNF
ncbi:MAG: hypothetical protein HYW86_04925 [Candidatus Roizmanbacteria bacterium]|nr:MAG: hypothetical protein HYW86_04925 [Candidatus Roizmanbacteria bacterium]